MLRKLVTVLVVFGVLAVSLGLVGIASAQGSEDEVAVTVKEFTVTMSVTSVPANTPLKFVATNKGSIAHEVVLEKFGVADEPLEINGVAAEIEDLGPGETKSATWTISEPGEYQLACHVPGHFEAGMFLKFTVVAAAAPAAPAPAAPAAPAKLPATGGVVGSPLSWVLIGLGLLLLLTGAGLALRHQLAKAHHRRGEGYSQERRR